LNNEINRINFENRIKNEISLINYEIPKLGLTSEFEKIDNEKISNIKFDENFNKKDYFNDIEDSFQSIENNNQINLEIEKYELKNSSKDIIQSINSEKIQSINSEKIQSINSDQSFFDSRLIDQIQNETNDKFNIFVGLQDKMISTLRNSDHNLKNLD
jgi:hypothetical protein